MAIIGFDKLLNFATIPSIYKLIDSLSHIFDYVMYWSTQMKNLIVRLRENLIHYTCIIEFFSKFFLNLLYSNLMHVNYFQDSAMQCLGKVNVSIHLEKWLQSLLVVVHHPSLAFQKAGVSHAKFVQ